MAEAKKVTKTKTTKKAAVKAVKPAKKSVAKAASKDKKLKNEAELIVEAAPAAEVPTEEQEAVEEPQSDDKPIAKAGKRSHKALEEEAEKQAKEERKASKEEAPAKPKTSVKPARSRLERRGKKFRESAKLIEAGKLYNLEQAVELAKKTSSVKFDATVELHVNLGVDPRQADQNIRDNLVLPAGSGKSVRVAVFAEAEDAAAAKKAGADIAGDEEIVSALEKGTLNFDTLIATPAMMPKLGKYARVLGPKGLMPNPKSGTVTTDVNRAVAEAKAGRVEYRVDSTGIVHVGIGKISFTEPQLLENLQAILASIKNNKPGSVKGIYFKSIHLTTTMGPSIAIDIAAIG